MNKTWDKVTSSDFSYFSLHINRSFALGRTGLNVRKSTYRSVKKQHALGRPENEDNSELKFQEVFLILCMCVHYKWSTLSRKIVATFFILKSVSTNLWLNVSVKWLLIFSVFSLSWLILIICSYWLYRHKVFDSFEEQSGARSKY